MGNGGTENNIQNIKQGGNNNINFYVYLFDCINSSVASNTDSFGLDSVIPSVDTNTNFLDFDCVDFNINSLNKDFHIQTNLQG